MQKSNYYEYLCSIQQLRVLLMLELLNGVTDRDILMTQLNVSKSVLSEKTTKLEGKQLIEKDGRRPQTLNVTRKGRIRVKQFFCDLVKLILFSRSEYERCHGCLVSSIYRCIDCRISSIFKS